MTSWRIVPALRPDICRVFDNLRTEDAEEMAAWGLVGEDLRSAMLAEWKTSKVALVNEVPVAVGAHDPASGYCWLLCADDVPATLFRRLGQEALSPGKAWTVASEKNALHRSWLEWMGFRPVGEVRPGFHLMEK